jgi:carboxypeptidase Taq
VTPYQKLEQRFRRITAVEEAAELLYWDQAALMPEGGRPARAEQLAALNIHAHELLTAAETGELLDQVDGRALDHWQKANLRETALPPDLVDAMSRASTACEAAWRQARPIPRSRPKSARAISTRCASGSRRTVTS